MKKEATRKVYDSIRRDFDAHVSLGWKTGRIIDWLCSHYGLSFRTIARKCGFR